MFYFDNAELAQAACSKQEINMFFPEYEKGYLKEIGTALKMCATCPIAAKCLQVALANNEMGVWGGTLEIDRDNIRKGRPGLSRFTRLAIASVTPKTETQMRNAEAYKLRKEREAKRKALYELRVTKLLENNEKAKQRNVATANTLKEFFTDEFAAKFPEDTVKLVKLRIANPSISLTELGGMMDPPINKDQVAGKLRRVMEKFPK